MLCKSRQILGIRRQFREVFLTGISNCACISFTPIWSHSSSVSHMFVCTGIDALPSRCMMWSDCAVSNVTFDTLYSWMQWAAVDEGHRVKNMRSKLGSLLKKQTADFRLLLTVCLSLQLFESLNSLFFGVCITKNMPLYDCKLILVVAFSFCFAGMDKISLGSCFFKPLPLCSLPTSSLFAYFWWRGFSIL